MNRDAGGVWRKRFKLIVTYVDNTPKIFRRMLGLHAAMMEIFFLSSFIVAWP